MGATFGQSLKEATMPCFGCRYAYTCRYYQNTLWDSWIIANGVCPVGKYTLESLYYAIEDKKIQDEERKRKNSSNKRQRK